MAEGDNIIICANKDLSILELLMSSIATVTALTGVKGFRIVTTTSTLNLTPVTCANKIEFETLLRQCFVVASDGFAALRVVMDDYLAGTGLGKVYDCGAPLTLYEALGMLFVVDDNGNVSLKICNITT